MRDLKAVFAVHALAGFEYLKGGTEGYACGAVCDSDSRRTLDSNKMVPGKPGAVQFKEHKCENFVESVG